MTQAIFLMFIAVAVGILIAIAVKKIEIKRNNSRPLDERLPFLKEYLNK